MHTLISANLEVAVFLRKEPLWWVAYCPALELASEGKTKAHAVKMFTEALSLYVEDCEERGTLREIVQQAVNTGKARAKPQGQRATVMVPVIPAGVTAPRHAQAA